MSLLHRTPSRRRVRREPRTKRESWDGPWWSDEETQFVCGVYTNTPGRHTLPPRGGETSGHTHTTSLEPLRRSTRTRTDGYTPVSPSTVRTLVDRERGRDSSSTYQSIYPFLPSDSRFCLPWFRSRTIGLHGGGCSPHTYRWSGSYDRSVSKNSWSIQSRFSLFIILWHLIFKRSTQKIKQ